MALFLLVALVAVTLTMIVWGLREKDRIYQFPTLAGVAWLGYLVPQAIGVLNNPRSVPSRALGDGGLELALLMSVLCAAASFIGYLQTPKFLPSRRPPADYSTDRLFIGGCLLYFVAFVAFHKLTSLCGGYISYFSTEGAYTLRWRGLPVVCAFFVQFVYPGLLLCLVAALDSRSALKWFAVAAGCVIPLANAIFLGRRQETIVLLLLFGITVYFAKRWTPPRIASVAAMVLGSLMIVVAPAYRANSQIGGDHRQLGEINVRGEVMDRLQGHRTWEFENAVTQMAAVGRSGQFGLGTGLYNRTVSLLVPRLIVGDELKDRLLLSAPDHRDLTWRYYRWVTKPGTYSTGVCDAFREFWFFGVLVFYVLGRSFHHLWQRASYGSTPARLVYVTLSVIAMTSVVNNICGIPAKLIFLFAFLYPIICCARVNTCAWRQGVEALEVGKACRP